MQFHPNKCKVLPVTGRLTPTQRLIQELPFTNHYSHFVYSLGDTHLDSVDSERDLGLVVTRELDWTSQCEKIYSRANQRLGLTRRTCHFLTKSNRRRVLYLAMVRSQFEHCSQIWRPTTRTLLDKLERLQRRAVKWILFEEHTHYTHRSYILKCKNLKIMPLSDRFDFLDLVFFFKIIKGMIPVELPSYIIPYQGSSRLRRTHLDHLSYVSTVTPRTEMGPLAKSFFYRTFTMWNHVPLEIRQIESLSDFKVKLTESMWCNIVTNLNDENDIDDEIF